MRMIGGIVLAGLLLASCASDREPSCRLFGSGWQVTDRNASLVFSGKADLGTGEFWAVVHRDGLLSSKGAIALHSIVVTREGDAWVVRKVKGEMVVSTLYPECGKAVSASVEAAWKIHAEKGRRVTESGQQGN